VQPCTGTGAGLHRYGSTTTRFKRFGLIEGAYARTTLQFIGRIFIEPYVKKWAHKSASSQFLAVFGGIEGRGFLHIFPKFS